jgi:sulfopyruvate decarboxylase TPP-binding subunit
VTHQSQGALARQREPDSDADEVESPRKNSLGIADALAAAGISLACTLPETWLVDLLQVLESDERFQTVRVAKEEEGVGLASGAYFAGSLGTIVMSNSGFLTCCCALNGLAIRSGIPMLLLIVQRGELGESEVLQGSVARPTREILKGLDIPYFELGALEDANLIVEAARLSIVLRQPTAVLLTRRALLGDSPTPKWILHDADKDGGATGRMERWDVLRILNGLLREQLVVATFGPTRSEWHQISGGRQTFFMHGGMGMASSMGLGLALGLPHRGVWVFEGDGALALNLGSLLTVAPLQPRNLIQFVFSNRTYDATGSSPLVNADGIDIAALARAAGVRNVYVFDSLERAAAELPGIVAANEFSLVTFEVAAGSRATRKMPWDPIEAKYRFGRSVEDLENTTIFPQ